MSNYRFNMQKAIEWLNERSLEEQYTCHVCGGVDFQLSWMIFELKSPALAEGCLSSLSDGIAAVYQRFGSGPSFTEQRFSVMCKGCRKMDDFLIQPGDPFIEAVDSPDEPGGEEGP